MADAKEELKKRALDRLKATKQRLAAERGTGASQSAESSSQAQKRAAQESQPSGSSDPRQHRDASKQEPLLPANKKFKNYIEYDFSKMEDSHGGFMTEEVDGEVQGPSFEEWQQKQKLLQPPTYLGDPDAPKCFECGSSELDFKLYNIFKARVCRKCRAKNMDKYSLLTKTECREDYLLTEPELKDQDLLPHMERPNPHKTTYNNMMLYLRYQVEEVAFKKWSGPTGLDAEYERRETAKRERKERKFIEKLRDMRKKTRAEAFTKSTSFRHEHEWSAPTNGLNGMISRRCTLCGMTTEEIHF